MLKKLASLSIIGISVFVLIAGNASAIADMDEVVANFPYYQNINQTYSEHYNLVANSDLLIPKASPNENQPLGFTYSASATDITLTNGIAKFTVTAQYGALNYPYTFTANDLIYLYANFKSDSNLVGILGANNDSVWTFHSGSGNYEFISNVKTASPYNNVRLSDRRSTAWTPISVDYIGAINITDLVNRGILPSGLTDAEYKIILDDKVQDGSPYFNFNLEYDFTDLGDSVIPGIVSFLDQIGSAADWIHNLFDFLIPSTGDNNFVGSFGESRLIYLFNNMSPSHRWIQWFRLDDIQYESIFNLLTVDEKTFLGSLNLDEYEKVAYSQTYISLNLPSEEFILGFNKYAVSSRFTTYERCVAWALAQS